MVHARRFGLAVLALALALGGAACTHTDTVQVASQPTIAVVPMKLDPTRSLRDQLVERRHAQIARLQAYANAGVFPKNHSSPVPLHQLKDPEGNLCAVANLVHLDGHDDVIDAFAIEHNDVLIGEETSGPLHDWVLTSGLTAEEVAHIQAPAPPMPNAEAEMQANIALMQRFDEVTKELIENENASLDLALARVTEAKTTAIAAN